LRLVLDFGLSGTFAPVFMQKNLIIPNMDPVETARYCPASGDERATAIVTNAPVPLALGQSRTLSIPAKVS
jgi:hypothetical protein